MGKYTKLRGKVDPFVEESSYAEKISKTKQGIVETLNGEHESIEKLAVLSIRSESNLESLEACGWKNERVCGKCIYCLKVENRALAKLLAETMQRQEIEETVLSDGTKVKLEDKAYPSVKKDNRQEVISWLLENSPEMIVIEVKGLNEKQIPMFLKWAETKKIDVNVDYNTTSFNAMVNDYMVKGQSRPPKVDFFLDTAATVKLKS